MRNLHEQSTTSRAQPTPSTEAAPPASRTERVRVTIHRTITLMKPVTWFAPIWAFLCGAVASGALTWSLDAMSRLLLGMIMAGPILCGLSQVINDYCDRDVDAINEPHRLVPSGLVTRRHVQILAVLLTLIGSLIALYLGPEVALYVGIGLIFALAYSMKPIRAKRNGWAGNMLVSFSYEGLAWLAGHVTFAALTLPSAILALLYSIGAHGIMTVNDFKSVVGDTRMGIRSIPVMYGIKTAAWMVVLTMAISQLVVIGLLFWWGHPIAASVIGLLLVIQCWPYARFIRDPEHNAVFFNGTAIMLFVWGMLVAAIGVAH